MRYEQLGSAVDDATPPLVEMQRAWLIPRDEDEMPEHGVLLVAENPSGYICSVAIWKLNTDENESAG